MGGGQGGGGGGETLTSIEDLQNILSQLLGPNAGVLEGGDSDDNPFGLHLHDDDEEEEDHDDEGEGNPEDYTSFGDIPDEFDAASTPAPEFPEEDGADDEELALAAELGVVDEGEEELLDSDDDVESDEYEHLDQ